MPDYMILIQERGGASLAPAEANALLEAHGRYVKALQARGAYRDGERLRPAREGRRVRAQKSEPGPFPDPASLSGYYLIHADDLPAAVALATPCPLGPGDTLDVRPVMGGRVQPGKTSQQGKTFAFLVLGNAASEPAWVEVMDRIDADTHDGFSDDRFLGGLRLEAPGKGKRIESRGAGHATLDGPFLESKEIIGGLFFMRMLDLDEAAGWARETKFMRHGGAGDPRAVAGLTETMDEVIRRDRGRVIAQLVRSLGSIDAAEEAFQESALSAVSSWAQRGLPERPGAWLMTAAKNHVRDTLRHRRIVEEKTPVFQERAVDPVEAIQSVTDDQLRLIFTCCHPVLPLESQVALTLKLIAGFSTPEIARAFLVPETTLAQRIVRAKRTLEEKHVPYEVPGRRWTR